MEALELQEYMEKALQKDLDRRYIWSIKHNFYTVMGGFVFEVTPSINPNPLPGSRTRVTLRY